MTQIVKSSSKNFFYELGGVLPPPSPILALFRSKIGAKLRYAENGQKWSKITVFNIVLCLVKKRYVKKLLHRSHFGYICIFRNLSLYSLDMAWNDISSGRITKLTSIEKSGDQKYADSSRRRSHVGYICVFRKFGPILALFTVRMWPEMVYGVVISPTLIQ